MTYRITWRMVNHMKTTLNISDVVIQELREESVKQGKTMSELVEAGLRTLFKQQASGQKLPPLPELDSGGARVNIANREILYDVMER